MLNSSTAFDSWNSAAKHVRVASFEEATRRHQRVIVPQHLLVALLKTIDVLEVLPIASRTNIDQISALLDSVTPHVFAVIRKSRRSPRRHADRLAGQVVQLSLSPKTIELMRGVRARREGERVTNLYFLLMKAILSSDEVSADMVRSSGENPEQILAALQHYE